MSIVKMKRLHMMALESDRDALFDRLQHLGCLDVAEQTDRLSDPEWAALVHPDESGLSRQEELLKQAENALSVLNQYAPEKGGLLTRRPQAQAAQLFDDKAMAASLETAGELSRLTAELSAFQQEILSHTNAMKTLAPWLNLDVPLNTQPSGALFTAFGMMPASVELDAVRTQLQEAAEAAELFEVSTDADVHYLFFLCHKSQKDEAMEVLKSGGFSNTTFKDVTGTAREAYDGHAAALSALETKQAVLIETLGGYGKQREPIKLLCDRLTQEIQKEEMKQRLLTTDKTFFLGGWVNETDAPKLEAFLKELDCAYTLTDPTEEEYPEVPVKLKNGPLTRCMNTVTEMYSLPAYDGIDPNPLMFPFFVLFYGIMMADMGYGLLMIVGCLFILKVTKPRENMRNFFELFFYCGISTFIVGAMTGGFFGDFIPQLLKLINPDSTFTMPALFTPLDNAVAILVGSLVLGLLQIITGMAISVWKKCKDGCFADALWDEIMWWVILLGVGLMVLGLGNVSGVPVVLCVGGVMLLIGSTRGKKGFSKLTGIISTVYNGVSGFFSDTLSYLRLMALMLAGSVIAQVFNTLGAAFGSIIGFIIISMIGNALNLALNLLGCYVHDLRLQCLEYFNRFYKEGGKPYNPLSIQTKYIDIIKEEQ